ncbi:MAG TPA: C4-type zinc ribbon domain-containing protein [Candidatus Kryptonia bacterium]|nr:C4-type zinc ribbon domain-containing protein [Candidatus Kryptonia bacterium]
MNMEKEGTNPLEAQITSELDCLATLQDLDRQLREKTELAAALEREIATMDVQLVAEREAATVARAERATRDQQRRELEARLEDEENKMKDRRMRLNRVRNERELMALRREIEVGKEANQLLESEVIGALQALETIDATLAAREQSLTALEEQFAGLLASHRERIGALEREVAAERAARDRVASVLSQELRAKYEQIFARRGGTSVVEIRNGTCMGCHTRVPPQFFNELQKSRAVRMCPNCHRILIWRGDASEPASPPGR